jgi:Spy/CpxP family protein refolding chaperone
MKNGVAVVLLAVVAIASASVWAQKPAADALDMPALRAAVQADKKAFVASKLQLTDTEAKKFWPIYDAYQREIEMINRKRTVALEGLIGRDQRVSDLYARDLAKELLAADEMEIKARRTLHNRVMRALPAKKAARYLQLEAKIRDLQAYDIAATIPLVE